MEIRINGKKADITIEHEKTIGEIMAGLEQWLANSGHRLSGLTLDGQTMNSLSLEDAFSREIETVKILDIYTDSITDLAVMSLVSILEDIKEYESFSFTDRNDFFNTWKERPQSFFAAEQMPDLFSLCRDTFLNSGSGSSVLFSITEERLRELQTPVKELENMRPLIEDTSIRLVDLPLDIQTGKDSRAAQTIQVFTGIAEKIFRILRQLDIQGYIPPEKPVSQLTGEFSNAAGDLLQAVETQDTVLIGDLAEYEIAPRLRELYDSIVKISLETSAGENCK